MSQGELFPRLRLVKTGKKQDDPQKENVPKKATEREPLSDCLEGLPPGGRLEIKIPPKE